MARLRRALLSPRFWQWFHVAGTALWIGLSVPGMTVWRGSLAFIVFVSLYAIVLSHAVGAVAALGGRKADPDDPA